MNKRLANLVSSSMTNTKLQLALDMFDLDVALALLKAVSKHVDIIELGTPFIKYNGIKALIAIREQFPNHVILADLKTMDAGEYEARPFYAAGADICTVLGAADLATITGVVKAAKAFDSWAQADLINVSDKLKLTLELNSLGVDVVGIHTGIDQQLKGQTPFNDLDIVSGTDHNMAISVAGGIKVETIPEVLKFGPEIVVVGGAITGANNPILAAEAIRNTLDGLK